MPIPAKLDLLRFTPYARFGIDIPEWRVLATLGQHDGPRSAQYVVSCTRTHKSRISRAVAHLVALGLVERGESEENGRTVMLTLTRKGRGMYDELVPLLLARERRAMACLDEGEWALLDRLLYKLEAGFGLVSCADR